jgi:heme-degrading monooxygenase HmoA
MHARTGVIEVSADRMDDALQAFQSEQLPRYREQSGYKGFTMLADRDNGKILGISFWESADDVSASDELGQEARENIKERGGAQSDAVREQWEVVIDDMV